MAAWPVLQVGLDAGGIGERLIANAMADAAVPLVNVSTCTPLLPVNLERHRAGDRAGSEFQVGSFAAGDDVDIHGMFVLVPKFACEDVQRRTDVFTPLVM